MVPEILDRTKIPSLKEIQRIQVQEPEKIVLRNGIPVHIINQGDQEVSSVEFIFKAGQWFEPQKLVARFTQKLLNEGTKHYTSTQLGEKFDFHGASLKSSIDGDIANIALYSLNKHLPDLFPYLEEVIKFPVFPENELKLALTNSKERFKVSKSKNEYKADKKLQEVLFGEAHPYGYTVEENDFDKISSAQLKSFHQQYYNANNCYILVAGKIDEFIIKLIDKHFGSTDWLGSTLINPVNETVSFSEVKHREKDDKSMQSALRLGKLLFNKTHSDYTSMYFVNALLGGYFGSRLMSNIREDKGFTYGIHSGLATRLHGGYFYVSTEVGVEVADEAMGEIYKEIDRLRNEPVAKEEMELVRNYLSGKLLAGLDGPFHVANMYKGLMIYGLDTAFLYELIKKIKTITPGELQEMATKYLDPSGMYEIIVG